jgi:hypothetical protein
MRLKVFLTGFLQVFFISINTYFISKGLYIGVGVCAFLIAIVWSFNVSVVSYDRKAMMLYYASGSAIGSVLGLMLSKAIVEFAETINTIIHFSHNITN